MKLRTYIIFTMHYYQQSKNNSDYRQQFQTFSHRNKKKSAAGFEATRFAIRSIARG